MRENYIDFDDDELRAAERWHGGQSSMLYAISSTGSLRRGTIRPRNDDGSPMTDEEWMDDLASRLAAEASMCARDAMKQSKSARGSERRELLEEEDALTRITLKAEEYIERGAR